MAYPTPITYTVTVTDANNCTASGSATINPANSGSNEHWLEAECAIAGSAWDFIQEKKEWLGNG